MKTTKKDFAQFQAEFRRWQRLLGMTDWRISYEHTQLGDAYADISPDCESRCATVRLNSVRYDCNVLRSARHEALELLLAPLEFYRPVGHRFARARKPIRSMRH